MWRAYDELGFLQYSFVETVEAMHPYYVIRALGGLLFLDRRADHGLQHLAHRSAATCAPRSRWRGPRRAAAPAE